MRDIARFAWHDFRFVKVGENRAHLATARERALELVAGHSEAEVIALAEDIYDRNIAPRLWPETVDLTREHLAKGHEVWLISATPQLVGQVIADRLGLTGALGTVLEAEDGRFTGELIGNVVHAEEKAVVAEALARERGVSLADCWAYSDSTNDIPLLTHGRQSRGREPGCPARAARARARLGDHAAASTRASARRSAGCGERPAR